MLPFQIPYLCKSCILIVWHIRVTLWTLEIWMGYFLDIYAFTLQLRCQTNKQQMPWTFESDMLSKHKQPWFELTSSSPRNCEGRWCTTDDFATSFFHFSLFSTALCDLANSRPVHCLMLSFHLFLSLPCLLPPFTVPCKMVLARPDERETWPYHCSLRLFTMVRRSLCGPIACWILAWTSSLVTWSLYEMCSILR